MFKGLFAIVAAALVAGAITGFSDFGPEAAVGAPIAQELLPQRAAPDACAQRGWPYQCTDSGRTVRVIVIDRLTDLPALHR